MHLLYRNKFRKYELWKIGVYNLKLTFRIYNYGHICSRCYKAVEGSYFYYKITDYLHFPVCASCLEDLHIKLNK